MLDKNEKWLSVCELTDSNDLKFSQEFMDATVELGGARRKFASQLVTHWDRELGGLLDYFGPDDADKDFYSGVDGEDMDIREDLPDKWEYLGLSFEGLDAEWYRDVLRAKLVTVKLPVKLIEKYVKVYNKNKKGV